jgi:hypothetical protein
MKYWYKGESFIVFPNLEIYYNEDEELVYFSLVWMKFEIDLPICIKWKKNEKQEEK